MHDNIFIKTRKEKIKYSIILWFLYTTSSGIISLETRL